MMKLIVVIVALFAVAQCQDYCNVSDANKVDCMIDDQTDCQNAGCCWAVIDPNPNNYPYCYQSTAPVPPPTPSPLYCSPNGVRVDCEIDGQSACQQGGCCWSPVDPNPTNEPWCFKHNGAPSPSPHPSPTPFPPPPPPGTPPFSYAECQEMMGYFLANIDVQMSGAVVASPDTTTPGGSYYYHWMRDAALSMRALMITNNDTSLVQSKMQSYVQWVLNVQNETDPNGIDVRTEPKFDIPSGDPYTGGWCRPQTDGPGLRGGTLSLYALYLLNNGGDSYVKQYLYTGNPSIYHGGAIKYDLDWVADNWQSSGCDLWEEVQSTDFFWNRYAAFRYGLTVGANVADQMGDSATATKYRNAANAINATILPDHYNGDFIYESSNREKDVATILGFNDGYLNDGFLAPNDFKVSQTIGVLNDVFNSAFPINGQDTADGYGGILYGRYEGDQYAGGNPWILSTAALAQLYYNGAIQTQTTKALPEQRTIDNWKKIWNLPKEHEFKDYRMFAEAQTAAGDQVLYRLRLHTLPYDLHMSEQLDKYTGVELSATDLTWSYATVLKAMHYRNQTQTHIY